MRHRYYKISIQLGPLRYVNNSKVYDIEDGKSTIIPGLTYSITTLFLGWWGFRWHRAITETTEALSINFSGGDDITNLVSKSDYDEDTNYIWDNLLRETTDKISKDDLEIILSLQSEFIEKHSSKGFREPNFEYLLFALKKLGIHSADRDVLVDFFDTFKMFESRSQ